MKPFKILVCWHSRANLMNLAQQGEMPQDQLVQVWGESLFQAANAWGQTCERAIYSIADTQGNILFSNGGDLPIR